MNATRLLHLLPEGCSHTLWGRCLNEGGRLLGLHGHSLFIAPETTTPEDLNKPLVLFMGGSADSRHRIVLNQVFKRYHSSYQHQQALGYGTFHQVDTFFHYIKANYQAGVKIALVGHSYGGYGVMSVTRQLNREGIPVELLITLDPVACSIVIRDTVLGKPATAREWRPNNLLKEWINVYVDYDYMQRFPKQIGLPNMIALKGGPLKACQFAHNVKLPLSAHSQKNYMQEAHQWADVMFYGMGLDQKLAALNNSNNSVLE